ncbi:WD repeat protein [Lasiosphaeria miniovina]|uniref:Probable cytosolic iron-sulfur protein assembly protein 1 n=1 Tax=Lasiosphaeria miniovina TaxID=1954250 RepID=A0AA39ZZL9_9PEZI|nr:WD repeat protein [Lasiosphaeria miniovina]KAK0706592.1 WD repeat protein [Lasiosphaeria miniovina]
MEGKKGGAVVFHTLILSYQTPSQPPSTVSTASSIRIDALPPFKLDLGDRAWTSVPHPTLPLLATTHDKAATVFSLATFAKHSALTGGHARSVRSAAWQPGRETAPPRLVTGSFDATAGLWSWNPAAAVNSGGGGGRLETEVKAVAKRSGSGGSDEEEEEEEDEWIFNLVLEGHDSEVKGVAFSPSGQYLATCSRDKSVWIWEDVSAGAGGDGDDGEDEWETVAVLSEHDGDVKAVAWCPDVPGRRSTGSGTYSADVLASASYDDTVRIWREDADGEWVCVAVLEGHDGTVWGLEWEQKPRPGGRFPRLLTFSADARIRIWTLRQGEADGEKADGENASSHPMFQSGFGGLPNTMRRSLREEWDCTAVLPQAHTRDIYSVTWSAATGMVASTGSDGVIAVYGEDPAAAKQTAPQTTDGADATAAAAADAANGWRLLATVTDGHGGYEVNHVTWCKRFDPGTDHKGEEEMLVTTGDDGVVRPWQVRAV